jgi:hypothetical protein
MTLACWPTVTADALDMGRAARQLVDELGHDRCTDLIAELLRVVDGCEVHDDPDDPDRSVVVLGP